MIRRIRIRNFRSLRDVEVDLDPVTVLVGRSGTGKSNFVDAVQFLRDVLGNNQAAINLMTQRALAPFLEEKAELSFRIDFTIPGFDPTFHYDLTLTVGDNKRPQHEKLVVGDEVFFEQESRRWLREPALIQVPRAGEIMLGRLAGIEEAVVAFTALTAGVGVYRFGNAVLSTEGSEHFTGLDDHGRNYLEVMRDIGSRLHDVATRKSLLAALQRVNSNVVSVDLDSIQSPKTAYVAHRINGRNLVLPLKNESVGFRLFYAHLLALYQNPAKQTLLFEEPENGIYPGALSLLAEEFQAAPAAQRGQVILTTHSPEFLDHFSESQIRVVELVNLETRISMLAEEQRQGIREKLIRAGEILTVDPARREEPAE